MNRQILKITEGAIYCSLVMVFLFINLQTGLFLESMMYWLLSFPIIIYGVKYGFKANLVLCFAILLVSLMFSSFTTIFYVISAMIVGVVYAYGVRRKVGSSGLMLISLIFNFISIIVSTLLLASLFGYSLEEDIALVQSIVDLFALSNLDVMSLVMIVSVVYALILALLQGFVIHYGSVILLKRLRITSIESKSPIFLVLPQWVKYVCIACFVFAFGVSFWQLTSFELLAQCLVIAAYLICCGYGVCILWYHSVVKRKRWMMFVSLLAAFIPVSSHLIAIYGLVNQFSDSRKRRELV